MISIYKTLEENNQTTLQKIDNIEPGCWINIVAPSDQELLLISKKANIPTEFFACSSR